MIAIKELKEVLPVIIGDMKLRLITLYDLTNYYDNLIEDYYNEYLDFNFKKDINKNKLQEMLYGMATGYKFNIQSNYEARLILVNNEGIMVGGCTVVEHGKTQLELAYFIRPEYQNKGLAHKMLSGLIKALDKSRIPFNEMYVTIRNSNKSSICLIEDLGFESREAVGNNKSYFRKRGASIETE